jgi:ABC-type Co2+ transport system permease subunit
MYYFNFYLISKACNHYVETRHAIFLATILGDTATIATTSVIIGMDFLSNIYHGLKIVYLNKKKKSSHSDDNSKFKFTNCL